LGKRFRRAKKAKSATGRERGQKVTSILNSGHGKPLVQLSGRLWPILLSLSGVTY
jgi:hypothetical protein